MALSNWDTLAVNEKGEAINGVFTSPMGVTVEFYKNWLYVRDEKGWVEGGAFVKPTVMEVQHGYFTYKDVHIIAARGPQGGIFACVWSGSEWAKPSTVTGMVGCGVYGYEDHDFVGVTAVSKSWLKAWLTETDEAGDPNVDAPKVFTQLDFDKTLRFNQGDAYFAKHLGRDVPATPVGEQEAPALEKAIKK